MYIHTYTHTHIHTHTHTHTHTYNTLHSKKALMLPAGFEPTIPVSELPQTYALDKARSPRSAALECCRSDTDIRDLVRTSQRTRTTVCWFCILKYRVIHKSVKHFKNSQQIYYSTDRGSSYADRERNSPSFFYVFHRCSMCPPLVIRQISMR